MARDLIDREPIMHDLMSMDGYEKSIAGQFALQKIASAPEIDAVEVVRCKDCVYWRDRHVLTTDGQRKSYAEMPPEAFSETGIFLDGVTCEYGINCGSRCELDIDSGYSVDKSVFRGAGDFCSRGVKKGQEEECVSSDEALWLIVKEAGFHDGVLYTTPMIACSECGVTALHEQSGGMGHGGPQISIRWLATHYCHNCGKEMKNWRIKHETESSGGGMPE